MKHVSVLVPKGDVVVNTLSSPVMVFEKANAALAARGLAPLFQAQLVGMDHQPLTYGGAFAVHPQATIADVAATDLVLIPAVTGDDMAAVLQANAPFYPWIRAQHARGAQVASMCVGAFLLAATGLLHGRRCSTHWLAQHHFRAMFPEVELVADTVVTEDRGVYSSGGANCYWNLLLHLVDKWAGRAVAIQLSKELAIEFNRHSQLVFMVFQGQKQHRDAEVLRAQEYIEAHYADRIGVDELAAQLAVGRRNLERRFRKATGNTIVEYVQRVKVEAAKASLEMSRENVSEIMFRVGYTDDKAFRSTFKRITGLSPMQYRARYSAAAA